MSHSSTTGALDPMIGPGGGTGNWTQATGHRAGEDLAGNHLLEARRCTVDRERGGEPRNAIIPSKCFQQVTPPANQLREGRLFGAGGPSLRLALVRLRSGCVPFLLFSDCSPSSSSASGDGRCWMPGVQLGLGLGRGKEQAGT